MAAQNPPFALQSGSHSGELFRRALGVILAQTGVVNVGDLVTTAQGTPNMTVNVSAGQVVIGGSLGSSAGMTTGFTSQGVYYCYNDATVVCTIAASNPTNPRIDRIDAVVADAQYSGATNAWSIVVTTGTPASSPVAPAAPASSVPLSEIFVPASATSITSGDITDERTFVAAAGIPPFATVVQGNSATIVSTATSGTNTWITLGNVVVPSSSTVANVSMRVMNVTGPGTVTNTSVGLQIGSTHGAFTFRILPENGSLNLAWEDTVNVSALSGSQSLSIWSTFGAGAANSWTASSNYATASVSFN